MFTVVIRCHNPLNTKHIFSLAKVIAVELSSSQHGFVYLGECVIYAPTEALDCYKVTIYLMQSINVQWGFHSGVGFNKPLLIFATLLSERFIDIGNRNKLNMFS